MSRVHTCPIDLSEFAGATFKAAIQLPGTLPSRATAAITAHARRHSEISSSSCRSIEEEDDEQDTLARDLFQAASLATAHAEQNEACAFQVEEEEEEEDGQSRKTATNTGTGTLNFDNLRVTEPSSNTALSPHPTKLKLRLPAAAVHRRVRSLEALHARPSS
jgi:hypothetical protein